MILKSPTENNHLEGTIPTTFGKFQKIQLLSLGGNRLSGDIPASIGNLSQLYELRLGENMLEGYIPPNIGNCQMLQYLSLSQNNLRGVIPSEILSIPSLTNLLDLSLNSLSGSLPKEVGMLKNINDLDVSKNHLSGDIPETIGECSSLEFLRLQGNSFNGTIPSSLASLKSLRYLDLSSNQLYGTIPEVMQNISGLEYLNVSFNMLEGEVPTDGVFGNATQIALIGNSKLCGGISKLHLPPCPVKSDKHTKHHKLRLVAVIVSVVSFLILSFIITIYFMKKRNKTQSSDSPTFDHLAKVSYQELYQGTDGFSTTNLIGAGSFGSVYKGNLVSEDNGVAVKVFNLQKKGAPKSFVVECNVLKIDISSRDGYMWRLNGNAVFSVNSMAAMLAGRKETACNNSILQKLKVVWEIKVPLKIQIFLWRLIIERLPTKDKLSSKGVALISPNVCCEFCRTHPETVEHLFFTCHVSKTMWSGILSWVGFGSSASIEDFMEILYVHEKVKNREARKKILIIWSAVVWSLWRMRNNMIFDKIIYSFDTVKYNVMYLSWSWLFSDFSDYTGSFYDWYKVPLNSCTL